MNERESFAIFLAEWEWAYKEWTKAILSRIVRRMITEAISDIFNPRQQVWEAFTACQSITPR